MTKKVKHFSSAEFLSDAPHGVLANSGDLSSMLKERGFGEKQGTHWWLFPEEAMFLVEEKYLEVRQGRKTLTSDELMNKFIRKNKDFLAKFLVYKDLRKKGYLLKAGLKYGVDFRVYDKNIKPRRGIRGASEHAKFLVWIVGESAIKTNTIIGFNRIAHSVKKLLWLAVVDKDLGITYSQMSRIVP